MISDIHIIKIGGKIIDKPHKIKPFLQDFTQITGCKILVHGGGNIASEYCKKLGINPIVIEGRRITNTETLEIITMVYGGLVNKKIVSVLQYLGCDAVGISGVDGNLISATKRTIKNIDYGFVGDITPDDVNTNFLCQLINIDKTPVICPLTHDKNGNILNVNADTVATHIAMALAPMFHVKLIYCFEKQGVLITKRGQKQVLKKINLKSFKQFKQSGDISGGMVVKLENAFTALQHNVKTVTIKNAYDLHKQSAGTIISR